MLPGVMPVLNRLFIYVRYKDAWEAWVGGGGKDACDGRRIVGEKRGQRVRKAHGLCLDM